MKNKIRYSWSITFLLLLTPSQIFAAGNLTLDEYLNQVKTQNDQFKSISLNQEAAVEKSGESSLVFKPQILLEGSSAIDKKHTTNVSAQGDRTDYSQIKAGLLQQFDFGLKGQLSYKLSHTKIYNASANVLPTPEFKDNAVQLELSQSLWRNFNGQESKSQANLLSAGAEAQKHAEIYKAKVLLANAQNLYWSLSQVDKLIKVQKESLERAIKIRTWAKRRFDSQLADNTDFLQADAGVKYRQLELETSLQDQKNLIRNFNSLRGVNSDVLDIQLEELNAEKIETLVVPNRAEMREDTLAALESKKIAEANAQLAIARNKPIFDVFGSYTLNGRDRDKYAEAVGDAFKNEHETAVVGLKFQAPLDFFTTNKTINAYKKEILASDHTYRRKVFEQDKEWDELVKKFEDAKLRFKLSKQIEEAQKIKASNERNRLNLGRTLTSTVLTFEQDLASSQQLRIKNETDIISTYTQLLTFKAGGN